MDQVHVIARAQPADRYRDMALASRVEGATPHALVAMLYEELALALDVWARGRTQHERAVSILHALQSGLDLNEGRALADTLATIYAQMQRRLIAARGGDMMALAEVREGVASLSEAWAKIA